MKDSIYHKMAEVEGAHWWFVGRRKIIHDVITQLNLPKDANILEVGCGCGGNFSMLSNFGNLSAVDNDDQALDYARGQNTAEVQKGELPDNLPFSGQSYDLIALLDVLEHVDQDEESLKALSERLTPGGTLLLTVPAFDFLWSQHDTIHHHKRRYTQGELKRKAQMAGFNVQKVSYYNSILFPLIWLIRMIERLFPNRAEEDLNIPSGLINRALIQIFSSERFPLRKLSFPFGVSLVLLAQKDD